MDNYINSTLERMWGNDYFKNHVMYKGFDFRAEAKEDSPYFKKYGFKVSRMYDNFYSSVNYIHSDEYLSMDLYYFYVLPCLNKHEFMSAYTDKNAYSSIFNGFAQPETVIKRVNGIFYDTCGSVIGKETAVRTCSNAEGACVIKPTVDTCNGDGVSRFEQVEQLFEYGENFIVQRVVRQHETLARLNRSSLNTIRIFTYRDSKQSLHVLTSTLRIGGSGSIKDNASSGGWFAAVDKHGHCSERINQFQSSEIGSFHEEYGTGDFDIVGFADAVSFALRLHDRIPYFDLAGWDIAINEEGKPVFIEFNALPSVELPQIAEGTVFGDLLDDVMLRVSQVKKEKVTYSRCVWPNGFYKNIQIG